MHSFTGLSIFALFTLILPIVAQYEPLAVNPLEIRGGVGELLDQVTSNYFARRKYGAAKMDPGELTNDLFVELETDDCSLHGS
jgi:hypothetical protein